MRATLKYFWVVAALIWCRSALGAITAHYGVEGAGFYGIPARRWLPYALTRTWHTQLGIFWIATAWLATGLVHRPPVSGHEPKFQRLGVNFLFVCLLIIVVGSLAGQWLRVHAAAGPGDELLVRPPGLRIRGPGPVLADLPVRGPVALADPGGPGALAGLRRHGGEPAPARLLFLVLGCHRAVLRRRADLGRSTPTCPWSSTGAGGWCTCGSKASSRSSPRWSSPSSSRAWACCASARPRPRCCSRPSSFCPAASSARSTTCTSPARRPRVLALGATFSALEVVPLVLIGFEAYENLHARAGPRPWVRAYQLADLLLRRRGVLEPGRAPGCSGS